jgi:hypothetical protein
VSDFASEARPASTRLGTRWRGPVSALRLKIRKIGIKFDKLLIANERHF